MADRKIELGFNIFQVIIACVSPISLGFSQICDVFIDDGGGDFR